MTDDCILAPIGHLEITPENSTGRCTKCRCRITIGTNGTEYGHYKKSMGWTSHRLGWLAQNRDCPHRPTTGVNPRSDLSTQPTRSDHNAEG